MKWSSLSIQDCLSSANILSSGPWIVPNRWFQTVPKVSSRMWCRQVQQFFLRRSSISLAAPLCIPQLLAVESNTNAATRSDMPQLQKLIASIRLCLSSSQPAMVNQAASLSVRRCTGKKKAFIVLSPRLSLSNFPFRCKAPMSGGFCFTVSMTFSATCCRLHIRRPRRNLSGNI